MENVAHWSDEKVLSCAVRYGEEARRWRNRFLGLLPEVHRRKLYEKHGCSSVVEFAKKVGGISENQMHTALRLDRELADTPVLHDLFTAGTVSMSKMERVVAIATPENEELLVHQVQLVSQSTLNMLVKDIKDGQAKISFERRQALPTIPAITQVAIQLDPDVAQQLLDLRNKGINIDQELKEFLEQRKQKIQEEKESIAETSTQTDSRYIPARTKKILVQEHGNKCSIKTCSKPSQQLHHTRRFSIDPSHDPLYLAPLCKQHHEMAHAVDQRVQEMRQRR